MRALVIAFLMMVVLSGLVLPTDAQPASRARLVVDNRSGSEAQVQVWRYNGRSWEWSVISPVAQGHWVPIYDVRNGDQYRAILAGSKGTRYHTVSLQYDGRYRGMQSVWWVQ